MLDNSSNSPESGESPVDASQSLERELRELRRNRKFSLEEALGQLAGPGMLKGVSPVARREQAVAEVEDYLRQQTLGAPPSLLAVLARQVTASELFLQRYDRPFAVLATIAERLLESDYQLRELVREADVEWGRTYGERPFFERPGVAAHPDDPITMEATREFLLRLLRQLDARIGPPDDSR